MLAFDKDITRKNPQHPEEEKYPELKAYMDYQRKLDNQGIVYHSLDRAKARLQECIQESMGDEGKQNEHLKKEFLLTHDIADADTIIRMLRKLLNAHNATTSWYKMNVWYYALVYDCMNNFITFYNQMVEETPDKADELNISGGEEIDFPDWVELYFPDIDFHIGKPTSYGKYPLAKRNKSIEEEIEKKVKEGSSYEEALTSLKEEYSIEESSITFILGQKIQEKDMELYFTSSENPIYDYLLEKVDEGEGSSSGLTYLDQAYGLCVQLKNRESDKTLN
jgi:transcriptional regulator of NAD metabolism